ncbi:MAG: hypothetical protein PHD39_09180 [Methylobacter tundripaludum]|nr:hypothetical protein [Methylobacter tundripaludum]
MTETKPEYYKPIPVIPARLIPQQVIYPYPPFLLMDNGDYIEMPDILTLVKMVYDLRKRVEELEAVHE